MLHDITDRKRTEDDLYRSRQRYAELYNRTPALLHSTDTDFRVLSVSDHWLEAMGYGRDEVIGHRATEFMTPESQAEVENSVLPTLMAHGTVRDHARQYVRKDREVRDMLVSAIATRDERGEAASFLSALVEVTELRRMNAALAESEARYRHLVEFSPEAIFVSVEGRLVFANRGAAQLLGAKHQAEILGREAKEFVPPESFEDYTESRRRVLAGKPQHVAKLRRRRLDGSEFYAEGAGAPVTYGGQPAIQSILRDTTARRAAEIELRRAKEAAEAADRAKSDFLANMSHELRTPLNAIIGFAQVMGDQLLGPLPAAYAQYAADIEESGNRLLSVINDILDISKITAGRLELREGTIEVCPCIAAVLGILGGSANEKDLTLV
ncbi:MAG: PAS domain S-box protein [Alphaproteobacteria bacterium]|nr:PAS domain S-box protein [Alphaproteobacteria bacterium]